jgi:hypothetical protein
MQPAYKIKRWSFAAPEAHVPEALQSGWAILSINWLAQGMRGMQAKELSFRLGAELLLAAALFGLLDGGRLSSGTAALLAALIAHSANWTLNGQFWVVARYCRLFRGSVRRLCWFLAVSSAELASSTWLDEAVIIGSLGTGKLNPRSDLDLRLIFPPGFSGWWSTNLLLLRLRAKAFVSRVPLDAYAYHSLERLNLLDQNEPMIAVCDRKGRVARRFSHRLSTGLH